MGARPMARVIQEHIKKPLAEEVLFGRLKSGGHRPRRRAAVVSRGRDRAAGACRLVCQRVEAIPADGLTIRRRNLVRL
jgi:hypothetical protein